MGSSLPDAFYITNVGHPCFLDCDTGQTAVTVWGDGLDIGGAPDNITWELRPVAGMSETFYIINRAHGKFLDSHGCNVWVWGDGIDIGEDPDGIRWRREDVPRCPDTYYLIHVKTNKFLDTHGVPRTADLRVGPRKDSGRVALWGDGHDKGQYPKNLQWRFVAAKQQPQAPCMSDRKCWSSAGKRGLDDQKLFAVDSSTPEYRAVASRFQQTLPNLVIDRIERVENGFLHEAFYQQLFTLETQTGQDWNERTMRQQLFHGTEAVENIVNSVDGHGFLPLLSGTSTGAIFGDGTYFARDAKYSNDYARTLPSNQKQMLLVDVLVGRWTKGQQNMKMLPTLPGEKYVRYNSLVNSVDNPSIFVVQHSSQAYPKYLITYH